MTETSRFWDGVSTGDAVTAPYDAATEFARVMLSMSGASRYANNGGVWSDELAVLLPSVPASNALRIGTGRAQVYGTWYQNDANVDINIPTPSGSTRVDYIVLRKSWVSQTVRITRIAGVEGAGTPALVQSVGVTWDVPLCEVSITTGGVMTVTDRRIFLGLDTLDASSLINEFKNFPANVPNDSDLAALNLWWDYAETGGPNAVTFVDVAGEAGITETYEYALKAIDGGIEQVFTYANEPRIKVGVRLSAIAAFWVPSGRVLTFRIHTSVPTVAGGAVVAATGRWIIAKIENSLPLDGTYARIQAFLDGTGTFYMVPLGLCVGSKALALPPRPLRYVDHKVSNVYNADPGGGGTFFDLDLTANTSPLTCFVQAAVQYSNNVQSSDVYARRNGVTGTVDQSTRALRTSGAGVTNSLQIMLPLDDGQIVEFATGGAGGDAEALQVGIAGYWEWA